MQESLNSLQKWLKTTGYKFSCTKSTCITFSKGKSVTRNPKIKLNNQLLPVTDKIKILGLIFDNHLTWKPHITELKNSCKRRLNLIKTLAKRNWGADQNLLINTHNACIRSKFDYCCSIYSSAKTNVLKKLSPIHNSGLRIALGAFCSSPVDSILSEAGQPPLSIRRKTLRLITASKIASTPTNPTYNTTFEGKYQENYNDIPRYPQPFYHRITQDLASINTTLPKISHIKPHSLPPWQLTLPQIELKLHHLSKKNTEPVLYRAHFEELKAKFEDYTHIYTDGSKNKIGSGCSIHTLETNLQFKLPEMYPIFKCETYAILKALIFIDNSPLNKFIIFSDSLSGIKAIKNTTKYDTIIQEIQELSTRIIQNGKKIIIIWIPSHIGIPGNEAADSLAKNACALETPEKNATIDPQDLKKFFKNATLKSWNENWKNKPPTKLHEIKDNVFETHQISLNKRRDQVTLTRLRIGHTHLTHHHLITRDEPPLCNQCAVYISVKHILVDCPIYNVQRNQLQIKKQLKTIFNEHQQFQKVLNLLKTLKLSELI